MLRGIACCAIVAVVPALGCLGDVEYDPNYVPEQYAGRTNPVGGDAEAIKAGQVTYARYCVQCHGPYGRGDGPNAEFMDPRPASFQDGVLDRADDYLYWRIAEGGTGDPVTSDMPAWKTRLYETQIWEVISYLRDMP